MSYLKSGNTTAAGGSVGPRFQNKNLNSSLKVSKDNHKSIGSSFKGSIAVYQGIKKVGKTVGAAAAPGPLNTPSLRRENHGNDVTIPLVPVGNANGVWGVVNSDTKSAAPQVSEVVVTPSVPIVAKPAPWAKSASSVDAGSAAAVSEPTKSASKVKSWADAESDEDDDYSPTTSSQQQPAPAPPSTSPAAGVYHPPTHRDNNGRPELRPNVGRNFSSHRDQISQDPREHNNREHSFGGQGGYNNNFNSYNNRDRDNSRGDSHQFGGNNRFQHTSQPYESRFGQHLHNQHARDPHHNQHHHQQQSSGPPTLADLEKNQQHAIEIARQELEQLELRKLRHQQQQEAQLQQLQLQIQRHQEQEKLKQQQQEQERLKQQQQEQEQSQFSTRGMGGIFGNHHAQNMQHNQSNSFQQPHHHQQQQQQYSGSGLLNSNNTDRERPMHHGFGSHGSAVHRPASEEPVVWERAKKQPIEAAPGATSSAPGLRGPHRPPVPGTFSSGPPANNYLHQQQGQSTSGFLRNRSRGPSEDLTAPTVKQVQLMKHSLSASETTGTASAVAGPPAAPAAPRSFASLFPRSTEPSAAEASSEVKSEAELAAERAQNESYVHQQKAENRRDKEYVNLSPSVTQSKRKMLFDDKSGKLVDSSVVVEAAAVKDFRGLSKGGPRAAPGAHSRPESAAEKEEKWARGVARSKAPDASEESGAASATGPAAKPKYTPTAVLTRPASSSEREITSRHATRDGRDGEGTFSSVNRAEEIQAKIQERAREKDSRGPRTNGMLFTHNNSTGGLVRVLGEQEPVPEPKPTGQRPVKPRTVAVANKHAATSGAKSAAPEKKVVESRSADNSSVSESEEEGARPRSKRLRGVKGERKERSERKERKPSRKTRERAERAEKTGGTVLSAAVANHTSSASNKSQETSAAPQTGGSAPFIPGMGMQEEGPPSESKLGTWTGTPSRMPQWARQQPQQNAHAEQESSLSLDMLGGILGGSSRSLLHDTNNAEWSSFGSLIDASQPVADASFNYLSFGLRADFSSSLHGSGLIAQQSSSNGGAAETSATSNKEEPGTADTAEGGEGRALAKKGPREKYVPKKTSSLAGEGGRGRGRGGRGPPREPRDSKENREARGGERVVENTNSNNDNIAPSDMPPRKEGGRGRGRGRNSDSGRVSGGRGAADRSDRPLIERPAPEHSDKPEAGAEAAATGRPERAERPPKKERPHSEHKPGGRGGRGDGEKSGGRGGGRGRRSGPSKQPGSEFTAAAVTTVTATDSK